MSMTLSITPEPVKRISVQRMLSVGAILGLHIGLVYALQNGTLIHLPVKPPVEIVMMLNQPVAAPEPPAPAPVPPKKNLPPPVDPVPVLTLPADPLPLTVAVNTPSPLSAPAPAVPVSAPTTQDTPPVATPNHPVQSNAAGPKIVSSVEYLRPPRADYPHQARRMKEEGKVVLRVLVDALGHPEKVDVHQSSGFPRLDDAARLAMMRALFKPYTEDGKALSMIATATISFSLDT